MPESRSTRATHAAYPVAYPVAEDGLVTIYSNMSDHGFTTGGIDIRIINHEVRVDEDVAWKLTHEFDYRFSENAWPVDQREKTEYSPENQAPDPTTAAVILDTPLSDPIREPDSPAASDDIPTTENDG